MNSTELMEKVAAAVPDRYDFILKTAAEIKEGPFRAEVVEEMDSIMKIANGVLSNAASAVSEQAGKAGNLLGQAGSALGKTMPYVGSLMVASVAAALGSDLYDAARRGLTKTRNFKAMIAANPDLKEEDPNAVQAHFSTLHRFNPEFSGDPNVAGSYVRSSLGFPGADVDRAQGLVSSRKALRDSRGFRPLGGIPWQQERVLSPEEKKLQQSQLAQSQAQRRKTHYEGLMARRKYEDDVARESAESSKGWGYQ